MEEAIQYAWWESRVDGMDRYVLVALAGYIGDGGECFGSAKQLSHKTGLSERTVWRCLKRLQDAGEIVKTETGGFDLSGRPVANGWRMPHVKLGVRKPRQASPLMTDCHRPLCQPDIGDLCQAVIPRDKYKEERQPEKNNEQQSPQAAPVTAAAQPPQQELNPSLPSGKERDKGSAKSTKFDPLSVPLPHGERFRHAWGEWVQHRREKRQPLTPLAAAKQLKQLAALREADAVDCIARSVTSGWSGLFTDRYEQGGQQQAAKPKNVIKAFVSDPFAEELAEFRALRA